MSVVGANYGALPGLSDAYITYESAFAPWGQTNRGLIVGVTIASDTVDSGATPTTTLRGGLLLGQKTATGLEWGAYSPTSSTAGLTVAAGILMHPLAMYDPLQGAAVDRTAWVLVGGPVVASQVINLDQKARADMFGRVFFDDHYAGNGYYGMKDVVAKTADYTVTAADNGTTFTNLGATALINFTLPTIAKGLRYRFYSEDNDGIKITAATADTIVTHNDDAADSVALSTTGRNIGGMLEIFANSAATKWLCVMYPWNIADDGSTVTKATIVTA